MKISVLVDYGLVLDFDHLPRKTKLFTYEGVNGIEQNHHELRLRFGDYKQKFSGNVYGFPLPERFVEEVNRVLLEPVSYLVNLNLDEYGY